jgi:pimeloyl-ACP methyl ester carboxylesterase
MIHGFANSQAAAEQSYRRLPARLAEYLWSREPAHMADFLGFHWPGNHRLPTVTQLSYASRIPAATNAGQAFGRLLATLHPSHEVILVGHSLGCRVLLAALEWMVRAATSGPRISAAVLLAAAVPVRPKLLVI